MIAKIIRQSVTFRATPHEIYEALLDAARHAELTGSEVVINRRVGGEFRIYGGEISGTNLELVPDRKIVQSWRYRDWPSGHYSQVTIALAKTATGTRLTFTQKGVPEEHAAGIAQGWRDYYWAPLKEMLKKRPRAVSPSLKR